jgi:diguanylate cyclase (GGDEF)-like protein
VKSRLRPDDILGRYGGEEFAVILPETHLQGSGHIAEELRRLIEGHHFEFEGEQMQITVSLGCGQLLEGMDVMAFIKAADDRLYEAKRGGRNRVVA